MASSNPRQRSTSSTTTTTTPAAATAAATSAAPPQLPQYETLQLSSWRRECVLATLNRPAKRNAFNQRQYYELADLFDFVSGHPTIAVVLLTGAGEYFSSGADITDATDPLAGFATMANALLRCRKIVVAAVNGPAIGVATLLPHCDVTYASDTATFSTPFARIAVTPEFCSTYTFPRIMGSSTAREMLFFGSTLNAADALRTGLVTAVFPRDELLLESRKRIDAALVHPLADRSLVLYKEMVSHFSLPTMERVQAYELGVLTKRMDSGDTAFAVMQLLAAREAERSGRDRDDDIDSRRAKL